MKHRWLKNSKKCVTNTLTTISTDWNTKRNHHIYSLKKPITNIWSQGSPQSFPFFGNITGTAIFTFVHILWKLIHSFPRFLNCIDILTNLMQTTKHAIKTSIKMLNFSSVTYNETCFRITGIVSDICHCTAVYNVFGILYISSFGRIINVGNW